MNGHFLGQLQFGDPESFFEDIESRQSMAEAGAPYKGEIAFLEVVGSKIYTTE